LHYEGLAKPLLNLAPTCFTHGNLLWPRQMRQSPHSIRKGRRITRGAQEAIRSIIDNLPTSRHVTGYERAGHGGRFE